MSSNLTTAGDRASSMIDTAAQSADDAIRGSQRLANQALDQLAGKVESARSAAGPAVQGLASDAAQMVQRGTNSLQQHSEQWREQALQARDSTRSYIQNDPLKAVLLAAAAGAALLWLGSLMTHRSPP